MKRILLAIFLFWQPFVHGQTITLSGYVFDKSNSSPLPYVLVQLKGESIGTNTNEDGFFTLSFPDSLKGNELIVSFLGYESYTNNIKNISDVGDLKIYLSPKSYNLSEVLVKPVDPVGIVKEAIKKIPENYPTDPFYIDAYYREIIQEDSSYIKLADAACIFYYAPDNYKWDREAAIKKYYSTNSIKDSIVTRKALPLHEHWSLYPSPNDQVKIIEARVSDNLSKQDINPCILGGPPRIVGIDLVKQSSFLWFMKPDKMKNYKYTLEGVISYNDRMVYVIAFENKDEKITTGHMYIDMETFAFMSINFEMEAKNCHWYIARHRNFKMSVDYRLYNGKWYLSQAKKDNIYMIRPDYTSVDVSLTDKQIVYRSSVQFFVNNIRTENVVKFKEEECYRPGPNVILSNESFPYNKNYWENYNCPNCLVLERKILKDLQKKRTLEQQFSR